MSDKNKPWLIYPNLWKTESAWLSYVRGGVRRGLWNRYPPKIEFLKARCEMRDNPNERSKKRFPQVKMWNCDQCKEWFTSKDVQVDHRKGNNSLKSVEDIGSFVEAMLIECSFDDYSIMCVECHKSKSLSEAQGISFEEAKATRQAIQIIKDKKDVQWLKERGIVAGSNQKRRRQQIVEYLMEEGNADSAS